MIKELIIFYLGQYWKQSLPIIPQRPLKNIKIDLFVKTVIVTLWILLLCLSNVLLCIRNVFMKFFSQIKLG